MRVVSESMVFDGFVIFLSMKEFHRATGHLRIQCLKVSGRNP